jgi:type I restriction enzyme S subunit
MSDATRLIADVVTGKLDVRAAAAALPDEVEDAGTVDESEETSEDETVEGDDAGEGDA